MRTPELNDQQRELISGAMDLHIHAAPSPFPRRIGIREACEQAAWAGFSAVAFKSHHHAMTTDVAAAAELEPLPVPALSGVTLNNYIGGVNPYAVELSFALGGRMVWMPTTASHAHLCCAGEIAFPQAAVPMREDVEIPLVSGEGELLPEVHEVLALIKEHDGVLCAGHTGADVTDTLISAARKQGIERILVLHPNYVVGATPERCAAWAEQGVMIEHSAAMYDDRSNLHSFKIDSLIDYLRAVGPGNTMIGSDLGQANNPFPVEGIARTAELLVAAGVDVADVRTVLAGTPRKLVEGLT